MIHYVYKYTDPVRKEPIYIGMGKGDRYLAHLTRKDRHPLTRRIRSMSVAPVISFICENVDREFAFLVEEEAIAKYGRRNLGTGPLLNLTSGGEGFEGPHRAESKMKISIAKKTDPKAQQHIAELNARKRGVKQSAEHVAKRMAARRQTYLAGKAQQ